MPLRVLILSAAYGSGHIQAARAIDQALRQLEPDIEVETIEYFETFVSVTWARVARASYLGSITYTPQLYGVFYDVTEQVPPDSLVQRALNLIGRDNLERYLATHPVDVVLSVYPTPSGALSELRGQGKTDVPFATLVTDYAVHSQWVHPHCDLFMVAASDVAAEITARGIQASRIVTVGLPVDAKFTRPIEREPAAAEFGLDPDKFTVLAVAGAFGATPGAREQLDALIALPGDWQGVYVCGKNQRLYRSASAAVPDKLKGRIKVTGFTTKMEVLMSASDVLVTKAGGLTVSEALVRGVPMIIFKPIPGQEDFNTQYLVKHDAALIADDKKSLVVALRSMLEDRVRHTEMKRAAAELGRPDAALRAAQALLALARSRMKRRGRGGSGAPAPDPTRASARKAKRSAAL
jgi:processive 1,2-diacylglycerol beta-glucosyltransferase